MKRDNFEAPRPPRDNKLKAIAGLIQGLSYREMRELSRIVDQQAEEKDMTEALLCAADEILAQPEEGR